MDLIPAYLLIVACFLCLLFVMITRTKSIGMALGFLWMALWVALMLAPHWIVSFPHHFNGFLLAALTSALVIGHFVRRRRDRHPPCIRVNDPYRGYRLVTSLLIFIFAVYVLLFNPVGDSRPDDLTIPFLVFVLVLIGISFPCYEICGNGIWYWGGLHAWDEYESYTWNIEDDAAVVELKYRKSFWRSTSGLVRLAVLPENRDAAKQVLEANLVNTAGEEAKA